MKDGGCGGAKAAGVENCCVERGKRSAHVRKGVIIHGDGDEGPMGHTLFNLARSGDVRARQLWSSREKSGEATRRVASCRQQRSDHRPGLLRAKQQQATMVASSGIWSFAAGGRWNISEMNPDHDSLARECSGGRKACGGREDFKKRYASMSKEDLMRWRYQRYMQDYLGTVAAVDDGVGRMLDYLEKNGLTENTIVVYTSDQGFYLGEHGWFDKRFMYEESLRTPLLIRYPKEIKPGTKINSLVQNLDFAPTFLDYAGVAIPKEMQGESFRNVVAEKTKKFRDAIYYTYYEYPSIHMVKRHYGIRTDRYKLIHFYYDVDEWELYDLQKDPHEMKNVYNDPAYLKVRKTMHKKLSALRKKYKDSDNNDQKFIKQFLKK